MSTPSTTTPKLIPFDLNIALKHPERVRARDGEIPIQVAYFPEAAPLRRVLVLFAKDAEAIPFSETGCSWRSASKLELFLTTETKHIPWTSIDEVPEGVYFRAKASPNVIRIANGYSLGEKEILLGGQWVTLKTMHEQCEHSPNRNGPWLPCGKEVEA